MNNAWRIEMTFFMQKEKWMGFGGPRATTQVWWSTSQPAKL